MSPTTNNVANNEVLPASLMAAALLAVAVAASTLVAQQPERPRASQSAADPVVNNADPRAIREEIEAPIYGLTLEDRNGRAFVTAVEPDSRPWKAGFREGDYLVAVGDVKGVAYDKFLENVRDTATKTYEGDSFNVTILRDGSRHVLEVPGAGRTPEDLRKLQTKSEKAVEEKLEPAGPTMDNLGPNVDKYAAESMASTEDIEEYLRLAQLAQEQELSVRDQQRFGRLATVVVGGGFGWGGVGGVAGGPPSGTTTNSPGPSSGSNWQRPGADGQPVDAFSNGNDSFGNATTDAGAANTASASGAQVPETGIGTGDANGSATPGTGIGDGQTPQGTPQSNRLGAEMRRLQEMQAAGGQLNPSQTQRLNALSQLSQFSTMPGAEAGQMSPDQMQSLQQAAQSGQLNQSQRQNLLQLQRSQLMSEFARSAPGANRNMPAGAMQQGNRNMPQGFNQGLNNPGLNNPGLRNPGMGNPGVNNPGLGNPGLNNPGVNVPGAAGGAGPGVGGTGAGAAGAGAGGTGAGTGAGASGVGVQGAGSGIGDAN